MSKKNRIIDLKSPDFLQISLAPRRRSYNHHQQLTHREERKASFTRPRWIRREPCKVTLPRFKVSVVQEPVNGIVDKLKGAWSKVKQLVVTHSSISKKTRRTSTKPESQHLHHPATDSTTTTTTTTIPSPYQRDAVAECIEFIKRSAHMD